MVERGYCAVCEAKCPSKVSEAARPSAAKRGYGRRWQSYSRNRLAKVEYLLCVDPFGDHGVRVVKADATDHIVPAGPESSLFWKPENHQSLCWTCHSKKTAKEDGGFGRRG